MKRHLLKLGFSLIILSLMISSCTVTQPNSSASTRDDVYDNDTRATKIVYVKVPVESKPAENNNSRNSDYQSNNGNRYDYDDDDYYDEDDYDDDFDDDDNYYYNDFDYRSRIDRFHRMNNFTWRNYYYGRNWAYDPFYFDPFYAGYNFYRPGFSISFGYNPFWVNNCWSCYNRWDYWGSTFPWSPFGGIYSWYNPVYYGGLGYYGNGWGNPYWGNGIGYGRPVNNNPRPNVGNGGINGGDRDFSNPNRGGRNDENGRDPRVDTRIPRSTNGQSPSRGEARPTRDQIIRRDGETINRPREESRPTRDQIIRRDDETINRPNGESSRPSREERPSEGNIRREQRRPSESSSSSRRESSRPSPSRESSSRTERTERVSRPSNDGGSYSRPSSGGNYGGGGSSSGGGYRGGSTSRPPRG